MPLKRYRIASSRFQVNLHSGERWALGAQHFWNRYATVNAASATKLYTRTWFKQYVLYIF